MADVKLNIVTATNLEGLNKLKSKLEEVKKVAQSADEGGFFNLSAQEINQTVSAVNTLQYALKAAYDTKLNTVNIEKFNKILAKNNMTVKDLYHNLSKAGVVGQQAFMDMTQTSLMMGRSVKQTSKLVDEMQTTMMNTVKWGISSGLWNTMLSSVSKAWGYVKGLNADLTDIRVVTGKSADQMERFAKTANKAAKDLGVATRDYTQGALLYYQQGDDDETVKTKTDITAKASNITGQDMSTVSEQLTAVWNGYQVANQAAEEGMQVYEEYVDKLSAVAATTASDLEEQATAMSKVASAAYSMGVNFDDLNAQIATIVSVTRQAPESVGTALKTIYARLGDLKVDGVDEFGIKLGEVSGQLQTMGIEVLDSNGDMREMSTVMTEVAEKWNTWTSAQKQAAAVAMAGKRQYNNLIALFDNWDMYGESLETSMEAAGTLSEQQGIAMDSLEKKMQRMTTASEKMYDALFDEKSIGGLIDGLTTVVDLIGSAVEGVGGLSTILPAVGGMMLKSFGGKIANSITTKIENRNTRNAELDNHKAKLNLANQLGKEGAFLNKDGSKDSLIENEIKANVGFYKDMYKYRKQMTDEELAATNELTKRRAVLSNEKIQVKENLELAREKNAISKDEYKTLLEINEAGADGQKKLQELKEKNEKRQHTLEKLTSFAFDETDLSNQGTKEEALNFSAEYKHELNGYRKHNTNFLTQDSQVNYEISEVLKQAEKEGLEVEEVIKRINEKMAELGKNNIIKDEEVENIKQIYSGMQEITEEYKGALGKDFETVIGKSMRNSLGPDSEEAINTLKTKVVELQSNGMSLQEALIKAMDDLRQESEDLAKDLKKIDINIIKEEDIKAEMEAAKKAQELKQSIESVTTIVGGTTQAWGGFIGVINSFSAATDPALDSSERLKATFMGLITAAPMLVNGITSIVNGYKKLQVSLNATTLSETISIGVSKIKDVVIKKLNMTMNASTAATTGLTTAGAALGVALGAVAIAAGVTIFALHQHQKALEQDMQAAQGAHDEQIKLVESARKEKDAIDSIVESYKELANQQKDGELTLEELRDKTIDLCLQYEQQDLALKALIADYDSLNNLMNQAQIKADKNFVEESEQALVTGEAAIKTALIANAKGSTRDTTKGKASLDIVDGWDADSDEEEIQELLSKYGVETTSGHIYTEDFAKAIANNYDEIYTGLSKIDGDVSQELRELMDSVSEKVDSYKGIKNEATDTKKKILADSFDSSSIKSVEDYSAAINQMANDAEGYFDKPEDAKKWATSTIQSKMDKKGLRYAQEYQIITNIADTEGKDIDTVLDETQDKISAMSDTEINILIKTEWSQSNFEDYDFSKIANFEEYKQAADLVESLLMKTEKLSDVDLDSLFNNEHFASFIGVAQEEFKNWDLSEQQRAISNFYLNMSNEALKYQDNAVKASKENTQKLKEEKEQFIKDYANTKLVTITEDELKDVYSQANQNNAWSLYNAGYYDSNGMFQQIMIEDVEKAMDAVSQKMIQENMEYDEAIASVIADGGINQTILSEDHVQAFLDAYDYENKMIIRKKANAGELTTEEYNKLVEGMDKDFRTIAGNFDKSIEASIENTGNIEGFEINYKAQVIANTENLNNGLKDIQNFASEFKSLSDIVNDYNENGSYTIDNLMTLANMSSEMLSVLEFENGALKINEAALKDVALAKIDNSIVDALNLAQTRLQALAEGDLTAAQIDASKAATIQKYSIEELTGALAQGEPQLLSYLELLSGLTEKDYTDSYKKYASQIAKDTMTTLTPLMNIREQIANSDYTSLTGDTSAKDKELKFLEDEFDRYWDLNNIIEKTAKSLEDLSETQDKLTRGELQDSLREQNDLLEQQIVNYQNLRKEQEKEAGELKGKLLTFGVDFNADGSIANYAEVTQEALNYYNNLIERRKSGKITDSQLETGEKSYEKFKETLERYDSLYYDEMVETAENIADTQREILENNLQDFELSITIKTDAAEFDREVKDFETEIAKDFTKAFEDIDSVIEKSQFNVESYGESFNAVAAGISKVEEEILKLHNGENSDMFSSITEAQEKLKELNKEAMEYASNMKAAYEEAWEAYLEGIDQSQEKFDELQEKYSKINEELEYQKELIELIYGPKAYDLMDKFYEKQKENSLSQIKSLQYEKELWLSKYDAEAAKAGDEDQLKIAERISQIQSDLNSNVTSYIQLLKDEYANTISGILSNFESQLTNGSSLDDIAEEWERLTENSDKYFNNVEGLYETQTLANKIKDSINDTISVKNQEKLQALYDREIEYLREKENLTQYDLDAAEARYQIALKEIALEEARENKNAMKLMRDTNGNWSYQYVADEDNIAEKQQELSDAMYKFYELSDKAYQENLESIQKLNQEYFDKAEEIATNELLTEQEKELKLEELRKWYLNQYQLLVSENEIIRQNLANGTVGVLNNLYNQDATNFENMTLQEQAALTQVKELGIASFAELEDKARQNIEGIGNSINIVAEQNIPEMTSKTQELADTWGADDGASVKAQSLDALNSMIETSEQYQITSSEVAAAVKEDWGENGIAGAISNATQYVIDLEEATKNLCNDTKTNLATYKDNVDEISTSWGNVKTAIEDSIKQLNELYKLQGNPPPKVDVPDGTKEEGDGGGLIKIRDSVGGGGGGGKESDIPPDKKVESKNGDSFYLAGFISNGPTLYATSTGGHTGAQIGEIGTYTYKKVDYGKGVKYPYYLDVYQGSKKVKSGYISESELNTFKTKAGDRIVSRFDTGGYTGEWGSDGRMAILHEKELVLNKEDTSNILAAVNGIRQFSSIESAISKGIASMIMNMTGMGMNVNYNTNEAKGNQTKQVFNIQAEFPNANNVSEIREAILSLPGLASQQVGLNLI